MSVLLQWSRHSCLLFLVTTNSESALQPWRLRSLGLVLSELLHMFQHGGAIDLTHAVHALGGTVERAGEADIAAIERVFKKRHAPSEFNVI